MNAEEHLSKARTCMRESLDRMTSMLGHLERAKRRLKDAKCARQLFDVHAASEKARKIIDLMRSFEKHPGDVEGKSYEP